MMKRIGFVLVIACLGSCVLGQQSPSDNKQSRPPNQAAPRSDQDSSPEHDNFPVAESSSSKANRVDISPPKNDAKDHPFSSSALAEATGDDVQEFHPWDPHRAAKDVEVGEFYLKRKNYRAAEDRFREALIYKPNDAMAQFRLAETLDKLGQLGEAMTNYQAYLKILPDGPFSGDARKALERIQKQASGKDSKKDEWKNVEMK